MDWFQVLLKFLLVVCGGPVLGDLVQAHSQRGESYAYLTPQGGFVLTQIAWACLVYLAF